MTSPLGNASSTGPAAAAPTVTGKKLIGAVRGAAGAA
jgi:hypothetical protein